MNMTNEPQQEVVNKFLNILRLSGITNMYGAGPYIQEVFDVSKYDANRFLMNWMEDRENDSKQDG
tara:strand:- start:160 stop:354 length:195 start_codon:yes stop_codon:yes gene_type:complete